MTISAKGPLTGQSRPLSLGCLALASVQGVDDETASQRSMVILQSFDILFKSFFRY